MTESCINLNGTLSEWFITELGVRQGDNLSPTLFSLFINGLAENIKSLKNSGIPMGNKNISILMYADDIVLLAENPIDMQNMLNEVNEWCTIWQMKVNMSKTKIMEIRRKGTERSIAKFKLGNHTVEKCSEYKYLGVFFDEFLEFKKSYEVLTASGQRALGALIAKFKTMNEMGYKTYSKLFNTNVVPIIDYGAEIWGYTTNPMAENVQRKAMRIFLGVHKYAANDFLNGDMGWYPSKLRRKVTMLRYWNRLINMKETRLTKDIFENELILNGQWCKSIGDILKEIDMFDIFESKKVCDLQLCKEAMEGKFRDKWRTTVLQKPKLRSYIMWKEIFKVETYVTLNLPRSHRSILAQLRSGTLPIEIETGRFGGVKLEDRKCKICKEDEIESEIHFILTCKHYEVARIAFFNFIGVNPHEGTPDNIMKTLCNDFPRALAKFCTQLYTNRKTVLFPIINT